MSSMELQERLQQIEEMVTRLDSAGDPSLRATAKQLVTVLMEFHGAGLERMLAIAVEAGEAGKDIVQRCAQDELVGSLFLLYDLHPDDMPARVACALEKARPSFRSRGAEIELAGLESGIVRLRIQSTGKTCSSTLATLQAELEQTVRDAAPD